MNLSMKPLPFKLPAVICPDNGVSVEQQEKNDAEEKNPDDHIRKIVACDRFLMSKQGAL